MIRIGIDYSLNSPSVTIDDDGSLRFISFFNTEGCEWNRSNPLKKFLMHNKLSQYVDMRPYSRTPKEKTWTYADEQSAKMHDAKLICELIFSELEQYLEKDCLISLEGFAFQSSGAAFIDLILFNSFLRKEIIEKIGADRLEIVAPTSAKKLAGKGNADKTYMINAFISNKLEDESLACTELYNWLQTAELDWKNIKPLDDLVDSYFIMRSQTK